MSYVTSRTRGGAQGCKLSSVATAAVRSFRSPSSISHPSGSSGRPSFNILSPSARPFHRGYRRPRPSLPSRLETLTAHYKKRGCSRSALQIFIHGHSDGTHRAYEAAWALFKDYLSHKRIHPSRIRDTDIFNFLAFHRRVHQRQYRTLAKYRAAIKLPIKLHSNIDLDSDFNHLFMRGLCREVPPPRSAPMPIWSLDHLLAYLCSGRFEPLDHSDFTSVVFKAIALLVIATGRRISCIAHLSRISAQGTRDNLLLFWPPSYRPKNFVQLERNRAKLGPFALISPSIRQLDPRDPSHPLCPVRAYRYLLERTAGPGFSSRFLWDHGSHKDQVNVQRLSDTFIKVIVCSQDYAHAPRAESIGPHQGRKLAASYGFMCCNSLSDEKILMQDMGCSSLQVLRKVYINSVPPLSYPCVVPGGIYIPGHTRTVPYRPYRTS